MPEPVAYGDHEYGAVDDCTRCIHCEVLPGAPGPCHGNPLTEAEAAELRDALHDALNRAW